MNEKASHERLYGIARVIVLCMAFVLGAPWPRAAQARNDGLIAYPWQDATGHQQIFTIREDGTGRKQLTEGNDQGLPSWSADGKRMAYSIDYSASGVPLTVIAVMNADGSDQHEIVIGATAPVWSTTNTIAFVRLPAIWVMNPDGTSRQQLTFPPAGVHHLRPVWSPDGTQLAYVEITTPATGSAESQIWTMNADRSNPRQITFPGNNNYDADGNFINSADEAAAPAWCSDGKIYFWSGVQHVAGQIWRMNSDGSERVQLTLEPSANSDEPACSPDGAKVLFTTNRRGPFEMWEMNTDGTNAIPITQVLAAPFTSNASWQPVPSTASLMLNRETFRPGDTLILTATLSPGSVPTIADAYVVVRLPDGNFFSLLLDGSIVPGIVPIAAGFTPFSFAGEILRYTFTGSEPVGSYAWLAGLTQPKTLTVIGGIEQLSFTFSP